MAAAHQNAAASTNTNSVTTATRCPSLRQRLAQASTMAWTVINVFSPAIPNILYRLLALWFISTHIVLAFVCTVMLSAVAEHVRVFTPQIMDCVLTLFVPRRDAFSMPMVDVIRESTRQ